MDTLTETERDHLAQALRERERELRDEVRRGLARMGNESFDELLSGTSDPGDESMATMMSDLVSAEVARDVAELRDILAAERRMAAGTYGVCVDCDEPIPYARLAAYPTAKRCVRCQEIHEATHAGPRSRSAGSARQFEPHHRGASRHRRLEPHHPVASRHPSS